MNVIDKIQKDQMDKIVAERSIPDFSAGDTINCLLYTSPSPRDFG